MNYKKLFSVLSLVMLLIGMFAMPTLAQDETIVDIAAGNEDFSTLVAAVTAAGLGETLSSEGPFTVFAPTNDAFAAALEELGTDVAALAADPEFLTGILTYHVVSGAVLSTGLSDGMEVETVNGATFTVNVTGDGVSITDGMGRTANVVDVDIEASNGVIHVLDNVILPPMEAAEEEAEEPAEEEMAEEMAEEEPGYGIPEGYEATENADGSVTLSSGDDTIIITSAASYAGAISTQEFETGAEELAFFLDRIGYTAGNEQSALADGAVAGVGTSLARRDQQGVGYLYDLGRERFAIISLHEGRGQVGAPIEDVNTVASEFEYLDTIAEIVIAGSEGGDEDRAGFSFLLSAVQNADDSVLEALTGETNLTVFAPNNQAFYNLFAFLDSNYGISSAELLADENQGLLTQVLLYHVVAGDIFAEDVVALDPGANVPTLLSDAQNGIVVNFRSEGEVLLNGSVDLVATDILAANGVVHVIDDVLLPDCVIQTLEGTGECDALAGGGEEAAAESSD